MPRKPEYRVTLKDLQVNSKSFVNARFDGTSRRSLVAFLRDGLYVEGVLYIPWHSVVAIEFLGEGWTD